MKRISKILSLFLALCMALAVGAFASAEPASGEAAGSDGSWDAYIAYLEELVDSDPTLDIYDQLKRELSEVTQADYTGIVDGTMFGAIGFLYEAMSYEEFAAQYGGAAGGVTPGTYTDGTNTLVIADDLTFTCTSVGQNLEGEEFVLTILGTVAEDGTVTITSLTDGSVELLEVASEDQLAGNYAVVEALVAQAMSASAEPSGEPSGEASGEASQG